MSKMLFLQILSTYCRRKTEPKETERCDTKGGKVFDISNIKFQHIHGLQKCILAFGFVKAASFVQTTLRCFGLNRSELTISFFIAQRISWAWNVKRKCVTRGSINVSPRSLWCRKTERSRRGKQQKRESPTVCGFPHKLVFFISTGLLILNTK